MICEYKEANKLCPGGEHLQNTINMPTSERMRRDAALKICDNGTQYVSYNQYIYISHPRKKTGDNRLCGEDTDLLKQHLNSFVGKHKGECQVCNKIPWTKYMLCNAHVCFESDTNMVNIFCCLGYQK